MFQENHKGMDTAETISQAATNIDKEKKALAFDLSGVWVRKRVFFDDSYLDVPPMDGAHEALREILDLYGPPNCYLCSHECNPLFLARRWRWLLYHGIVGTHGFRKANVHFCATRHEKIEYFQKIGAIAVTDDRAEIMSALTILDWRITKFLYQPYSDEVKRFPHVVGDVDLRIITNMTELANAFRELSRVPKAA